ncbi:MAG: MBL fold metallo-hydrolase [Firmicutes bacterium]|nr:MBL fold metallo-hydrolase [Bacillota bacterium]
MAVKTWRKPNPHKPNFGHGEYAVPATRFFDQLSFIGNNIVGCFVLETSEGFILIDCMEPYDAHRDLIVKGIADLGLELKDLKAILITHGHGDHYGTADWFRDQTGCKIYMSEVDYKFAQQDKRNRTGVLKWEVYDFLDDGDIFELGDTKVYAFKTPGHSPGCLSFIFRVSDEGREHWVEMWGGSGLPYSMSDKAVYMESCIKFPKITERFGCDVEISSHPFIDKSLERLEIVRDIFDGVANPFVIGREACARFEDMFTQMCIAGLKRQGEEADKLLPPQPERLPARK